MVLATKLGTLATVGAGHIHPGPGLVDKPGNGIFLHTKCRHPPGVNDIVGGEQETDFLADRNHQRVIDLQQVMFTLGLTIADLVARRRHVREKTEIVVNVLVLPTPLVTGDLDVDIRFGGVVHLDQCRGGGNRHGHQNGQWDNGPEHLHHGVLMEVRGLGTPGLAVSKD